MRNLADDDLGSTGLTLGDFHDSAHLDAASTRSEITVYPFVSSNLTRRGKIRPLDVFLHLVNRDVRIINSSTDAIDHLSHVVRRNIGGHTNRDTGSSVHEKVRYGRRKHHRLAGIFIIRCLMIDRLFFKVSHHRRAHMSQAGLGISHRRRSITLNRSEVPLTINERFSHRPRLGHIDQSGINRPITMRVILTHGLTHNTGALQVRLRRR